MWHCVRASRVCCHAVHSYNPAQALAKSFLPFDVRRPCAPRGQRRLQSTESVAGPEDEEPTQGGASAVIRARGQGNETLGRATLRTKRVSAGALVDANVPWSSEDGGKTSLDSISELEMDDINDNKADNFSDTGLDDTSPNVPGPSETQDSLLSQQSLESRILEFQSGRIRGLGELNSVPFSSSQWRKHMRLVADIKFQATRETHNRGDVRLDDFLPGSHKVLEYPATVLDMTGELPMKIPWRRTIRERYEKIRVVGYIQPLEVLGHEILDFARYIQPTPLEARARQAVLDDVTHLVQEYNVKLKSKAFLIKSPVALGAELFGSSRNGLAYCTSDVDVRICSARAPAGPPSIDTVRNFSWAFKARAGWGHGGFENPMVRRGRFPSISTHHTHSGLDVQLVCNQPTQNASELIAMYTDELPCLKPLYHILRQTLRVRGADSGYHGGLTSYPLAIMIVALLKRSPKGSRAATPDLVSRHLLEFLRFYANFPTRTKGIIADPFTTFQKRPLSSSSDPLKPDPASEEELVTNELADSETSLEDQQSSSQDPFYQPRSRPNELGSRLSHRRRFSDTDPLMPYLLCLEDPALEGHDVGSRVYAIKHILATFQSLLETMEQRLAAYDEMSPRQKAEDGSSLLLPLVGRVHEQLEARRFKLQGYGLLQSLKERNGGKKWESQASERGHLTRRLPLQRGPQSKDGDGGRSVLG